MTARHTIEEAQLGFDALLVSADSANAARRSARASSHLPDGMQEAVPFYRALLERHHAAMLTGDADTVMTLRGEAHQLASKLNNHEPGIIASDDAPGCVLDRATRAADGVVPLWGQSGSFEITVSTMRARIAMEGIFGLASNTYHWLGFEAYAVAWDKPFLSETGYRSFIAVGGELEPGFTPDTMAAAIIAEHVKRELKGRLVAIKSDHRARKEKAMP